MAALANLAPNLRDQILLLLSFSLAVLFCLSLVLALYTVGLRFANARKAARWQRLEQEWEDVLLDTLSGAHGPAVLWQRVPKKEVLYFVDFLLRYARRLQGRERDLLAELARPFLEQVAGRTREGDPEQRARAVQTLSVLGFRAHTGLSSYEEELRAALDDPSPLVAMVAARALARSEHPEYAGAILERLHRFEGWSPEFLAAMLAAFGGRAAAPLRETFGDPGKSPRVRAVAAEGLRRLHDLEAADLAVRVLEKEVDREVVAASLRLLAESGRPEHLPSIRALCASPDFVVRAHTASALGKLGEREDVVLLRRAFEDDSPWVAQRAVQALKEMGEREVLREFAASAHPRASLAQQVLKGEGR